MKKFVSSILFFGAVSAFAVPQDNVGVGVGTMIFKDSDGLMSQTAAVTTNHIFCNQTFAITSGTLDAEKPAEFWAQEQMNIFIAGNMDNVAKDIAMGEGEAVDTIAGILKVEDTEAFRAELQENFANIYTTNEVTHTEVVSNIMDIAKS
ncbi:DUF3015 family protein [Lentisphaera profundi]|uniref:DUF3015 family protein n=1 Tax=Lentisphaera profundi TaxID=1658616 RepID=A0ABY7VUK1_9BACT|nr:DUF3015 family protein [Lentisphaera profundi]WDE97875.1 DUF3015 family protein [Lentisphaera profundi]